MLAYFLPLLPYMPFECEHCGAIISGKSYRVSSVESGIRLLDMIVCRSCFIDSQKLGLQAEEMESLSESQSPRNGGLR